MPEFDDIREHVNKPSPTTNAVYSKDGERDYYSDPTCDCPVCEGKEGYRLADEPLPPNAVATDIGLVHWDAEQRRSYEVLGQPSDA